MKTKMIGIAMLLTLWATAEAWRCGLITPFPRYAPECREYLPHSADGHVTSRADSLLSTQPETARFSE
ncbi:MAG: hypothetical protein KDC66_13230 [Phaeodactylibacter sp.]|nr:hypothetical protein [Phaeodactylibacter sp.]MCB9273031.1 hypothetical protein [Lewinellaceae bacterium]